MIIQFTILWFFLSFFRWLVVPLVSVLILFVLASESYRLKTRTSFWLGRVPSTRSWAERSTPPTNSWEAPRSCTTMVCVCVCVWEWVSECTCVHWWCHLSPIPPPSRCHSPQSSQWCWWYLCHSWLALLCTQVAWLSHSHSALRWPSWPANWLPSPQGSIWPQVDDRREI